jgi:Fe2+ transport system protein FeoA
MTLLHPVAESPLVALTQVHAGDRIRVAAVDAGRGVRARLCAMGLTQGMAADVISVGAGPVILSVMGTRLVLGHGMASKVLVKHATAPK